MIIKILIYVSYTTHPSLTGSLRHFEAKQPKINQIQPSWAYQSHIISNNLFML